MWPQMLPDGRIMFTSWREEQAGTSVLLPGNRQVKIILESGTHARYLQTGDLIYVQDGQLLAARFNVEKLEKQGSSHVVVENLGSGPYSGAYDVSSTGRLAYVPVTCGFPVLYGGIATARNLP